jgi:hypothetical protein
MLQNLHELGAQLQEAYVKNYPVKDKALPAVFKQLVKDIDGATVEYNEYSFIVTITSSAQKIFFPNQLLYVAACFADYYKALSEYARIIKTDLRISDSDIKQAKDNVEYAQKLLADAILEEGDKELLAQFLSDYNWWYGGKGIERADYYISPILSLSKLVNASQSYVADLCRYLARNEKALQALKDEINSVNNDGTPRQIIFYGAPGTGKSHKINEDTCAAERNGNVFRTTFHPDSDYSTFVGAYKPTMEKATRVYTINELKGKLKEIKESGTTYPCHKFSAIYWESLKDLSANEQREILAANGFTDNMTVEFGKGIAIGQEFANKATNKQIIYSFVPQAFTNAYIRAWQTNEPVYLVIEEINRGNCAQIFGDLFQLLDRDDEGKSKYPIIPDTDLGNYIESQLLSYDNVPEEIRQGKSMLLPSNLFIWASMNTSDQSLFPIDSAFKRRWDWKYVPIENAHKNYVIQVNNTEYVWWEFLKAINKEVFELTNSEDKQLGYFFVKKTDGIIDAETLVNKVYFYLWNDVFKDYDLDSQKAFRNQETQRAISFKEFFVGGLNEELAEQVLLNLELEGRPLDE